jgi:hypothetical protein
MENKLIEVRDKATMIPMLAIRLGSQNEAERFLLSRAGYGPSPAGHGKYILLADITGGGGEIHCDIYDWGQNPRTKIRVHDWLIRHWNDIKSGDVIDVEFILGETMAPKQPERIHMLGERV